VQRDGSNPRTLAPGLSVWHPPTFSPTGTLLATGTASPVDSLIVLSLAGTVRTVIGFDRILGYSWCGDETLVVVAEVEDETAVFHISHDQLPTAFLHNALHGAVACSPDGSHVIAAVAVDGMEAYVLADIRTGQFQPIPARGSVLRWWPTEGRSIPDRLELDLDETTIPVGRIVPVRAWLRNLDGSRSRVGPELQLITEPSGGAAVLADGSVIGNRPGRVILIGRYRDVFEDSVVIEVSGVPEPSLLMNDPLARLESATWQIFGQPKPENLTIEGERVLHLTGDNNLADGIVTQRTFNSAEGLTLEVEFRLPLTRHQGQWLNLALCSSANGAPPIRLEPSGYSFVPSQEVAFRYPAAEPGRFDAKYASLFHGLHRQRVQVGALLPKATWVHAAVQLHPDGYSSLVLEREVVARSRLRSPQHVKATWHACLRGASVGTLLLVRNLTVWRGVRY
jgi:hypothetical protein